MTVQQFTPWPQLSFALAKQMVKLDTHKAFLTPAEMETFTQALVSFKTWKEFIDSPNSSSSNNLIAFRVRAMLSEQFIQSPHNNTNSDRRPCCQYNIDLDQVYQEAQQIDMSKEEKEREVSPKPTITTINGQEQQQQCEEQTNSSDHVPLLDIYHTLEFDMAAMIEQRKLEEHQAQEAAHDNAAAAAAAAASNAFALLDDHGGTAADNFNLKYLSKGITENRSKIHLSDRELRNLLLEVKPHRSKWANEDKVGQEDLYEACEKALTDLKNYTDHSTPFLSKVNKREAPDYFEVIKHPMDLGTVSKKLKHFQYKTKKEFSDDLYLIYENCLVYNTNPSSEYRKHAIAMRRKTDRLLARVPDIVVKENMDHDMDESDGEEDKSTTTATRERSMTHDSMAEPAATTTTEINHQRVLTGGKHPQKGTTLQTLTEIDKESEDQVMKQELDQDKGELQNQLWREITKKTRAKLTTDVEQQYQFDFSDRVALKRSSLDMERFHMLEHLHHDSTSTKKLMRCNKKALSRWMSRRGLNMTTRTISTSVYDTFDLTSEDEDDTDDGGGFFFMMNKHGGEHKSNPTDEEDANRTDLFLPEYSMTAGLPEIEGIPEEYLLEEEMEEEKEKEGGKKIPTFDIYPTTQFTSSALKDKMDSNIETISRIRSTYKKCRSIQDNTPLHIPAVETPSSPLSPEMMHTGTPIPTTSSSTLPSPKDITAEASQQLMQRSLTQILAHAGFESADSNALNILTDLMTESLSNLGKTARKYLDEHSKNMSSADILHQTLKENGVQGGVNDLEDYVTQDIEHYGNKLQDLNNKLETSYQDLISGSMNESIAMDEDLLFEEENDVFTTGLFDKELMEKQDFFGFKELGLDQEFHMRSLYVPPRLLYGKEKLKSITALSKHLEPRVKYLYPPPFQPVSSSQAFIGLLRPWYEKRSSSASEDEYNPHHHRYKPKYPPIHIKSAYSFNNKATQGTALKRNRNGILKDGSNTQQHQSNGSNGTASGEEPTHKEQQPRKRVKKASQPMDEVLKQQKKTQKSEQKLLKRAEREQKRKTREEEKKLSKKGVNR